VVGEWTTSLGLGLLTFTFWGLVAGSVLYSLPFMVQPVQNAMEAMGTRPLEVAASLRASRLDTFFNVVLPLCKPGLVSGCIMSFAHTVGEFGVVLMVGGNIPGQTRTVAVQIYDHVEALEYASAHRLAAVMLVFSFAVLLALHIYNGYNRSGRYSNRKQTTSA
ncbi:MAG: ABC transporter permease subunit, partial [Burkholderiaceae bacterium]